MVGAPDDRAGRYSLVLERQRHLKWRAFDPLEQILMVLCGVALAAFTTTVFFDVVTRTIGHPVDPGYPPGIPRRRHS